MNMVVKLLVLEMKEREGVGGEGDGRILVVSLLVPWWLGLQRRWRNRRLKKER